MLSSTHLLDEFRKAELLLAKGELQGAADLCRQMLDSDPAFAHGYHLMSSLFRATGNYEKALNFAQLAIRIEPTIAAFHMQQGQVFYALGDWQAAATAFRTASELDNQNPLPVILWADTLIQAKDYDEAHVLFKRARCLGNIPELDEHEGIFLLARGDMDAAEAIFDRVIARRPGYDWGHIHKGKILFDRGQYNDANRSFARALNVNPAAYDALHYMALISARSGDSDTAIQLAMRAVQVNSTLFTSLVLLGVLLLRNKDFVAAEQVFRHGLSVKPESLDILHGLINALSGLHRHKDALKQVDVMMLAMADNKVLSHFYAMLCGEAPDRPPMEYVVAVFDGWVQQFDDMLQNGLVCQVPQLIADKLSSLLNPPGADNRSLLDLGCGMGRAANALKHMTRTRIGVDLSSRMLGRARSAQLYDELYEVDMIEFMFACDRVFDWVVAADVLIYMGNIAPFLHSARNVLSPQGLLVFNIEKEETPANFSLSVTGHYSHSPDFIALLAREEGYRILLEEEYELWAARDGAAKGMVYVLQKLQLH